MNLDDIIDGCRSLRTHPDPLRRRLTVGDLVGQHAPPTAAEDLLCGDELWLDLRDGMVYGSKDKPARERGSPAPAVRRDCMVPLVGQPASDEHVRACYGCGTPFGVKNARHEECSSRCYAEVRGL